MTKWDRIVSAQKTAIGCLSLVFPAFDEGRLTEDQCGYYIYVKGKLLGTVYFLDPQDKRAPMRRRILTHTEICEQVGQIKEKWLASPDSKNPPPPPRWVRRGEE